MTTSTVVLRDQQALDAFDSAYAGGLCWIWSHSPNGGDPFGQRGFYTNEHAREVLDGFHQSGDWDERWNYAEWDGEKLTLFTGSERGEHHYEELTPGKESGLETVRSAFCRGAHYGCEWGSSCEEIAKYPTPHETSLLHELIKLVIDDSDEELIGLTAVGDPTDDGNNYDVTDEPKYLTIVARCKAIEDNRDDDSTEWNDSAVCTDEDGYYDQDETARAIFEELKESKS